MRAKRGSIGMRAMSRPIRVRRGASDPVPERAEGRPADTAPSSTSSSIAERTSREPGGVRNGNSAMSPKPSASICSTTEASEVRRISGSVNSGRLSKSSSPYRRIAMPALVRPARPERWFADACDTASIGSCCTFERLLYREMRAVPVSITYLMPGTVRLVSATFVARITRRRSPATVDGSNTRCCSAAESLPYSGSTSTGAVCER